MQVQLGFEAENDFHTKILHVSLKGMAIDRGSASLSWYPDGMTPESHFRRELAQI